MIYRVEVKPNSSFIGTIKSNTLFGTFCYTYSNMVDENTFKKELEDIVFSDIFYKDGLPIKIKNGVVKYAKNSGVNKNEVHNIIDRNTNKTQEQNGLFNEQVTFSKSNMEFYVSTQLLKKELELIIGMMLLRGLGAKKNKGKGSFDLVSITEVQFDYSKTDKVIALSNFIPDSDTPIDIEEIKIVCRDGITCDGKLQKPLYMLSVGSIFKGWDIKKEVCGTLMYDKNSDSYVNAKTIMYPIS